MTVARPQLQQVPKQIEFNQVFIIPVSIPKELKAAVVQGIFPQNQSGIIN